MYSMSTRSVSIYISHPSVHRASEFEPIVLQQLFRSRPLLRVDRQTPAHEGTRCTNVRITTIPTNDEIDLIPRAYVLMASWHGVSMFFSIGRNGLSISQGLS